MVKDPNYYDAAKVHLDKIVYRIIADATIRSANLRSGDVAGADSLSAAGRRRAARRTPSLTVLQSESLGYQGITINVGNADGVGKPAGRDRPPAMAKDARVRQAFEYAIDRDGLVKVVFNGLYTPWPARRSRRRASPFTSDAAQACPRARPGRGQAAAQRGRRHDAVQGHA